MDGLSGAASGIAVVSLAIQLGDSIKKLCDFWASVKEAPDDIRAITADLQLLSSVLAGIASEEQHSEPDPTLVTALKACRDNVTKLVRIADDMEPGFASKKPRVRIWTAFRAAIKGESIHKSQKILEGLKSTLTLALHNHHNRLNRIWHQSQQQDITTILSHLSSLRLDQFLATMTTTSNSLSVVNDQAIALRNEASHDIQTRRDSVHRVGFEVGTDLAVPKLAKGLLRDQSSNIRSLANSKDYHFTHGCHQTPPRARQQTWKSYYGLTRTFFGAMTHTTKTFSSRSGFVMDDILNDEEYPCEQEESFRILPAGWLLRLGFNCAYNFSTHNSSTQNWKFSINPINLIPDDALVFQYCEQGNIEMVRDLMLRNLASVRDVDSNGRTALHYAARVRSPELCRFLIEAGADKTAQSFYEDERTPLGELAWLPITQDGLVDAIDTCRIFDDSYNFWDESGDGWDVLSGSIMSSGSDHKASAEFSSWFVQSSSSDIKAYYDKDQVSGIIFAANPGTIDSISLLLEMGPPGTVDDKRFGMTPLIKSIIERDPDLTRMLLARGADPHRSSFSRISNRVESPLSVAMYSSWAFWSFRDALNEMNLHVEDIVCRELEKGGVLLDDGWQAETLSALLKFDFDLEFELPEFYGILCSNCYRRLYKFEVKVQPYWQDILERIKNGIYVQNLCPDTQGVQSPSSQKSLSDSDKMSLANTADGGASSHDPALPDDQSKQSNDEPAITGNAISRLAVGREKVWCLKCWEFFRKTGQRYSPSAFKTLYPPCVFETLYPPSVSKTLYSFSVSRTLYSYREDSSEDDFSPFLFNT